MNRRRPHVWQDDMAEVKETFRRVARARHSRGYSASETSPTRVTAPTLSRNRRARIRCQVPVKALHMSPGSLQVPIKVLQEIQGNRSQSPFVSLNHLQNVLGMCRRIQSQQSLAERKKNPHDPAVYPVYVRRPWSVSACMCRHKLQIRSNHPHDVNPNPPLNIHVSPTQSCPYVKGYAHVSPNIHNSHAISSQHDIIPGHVKTNVHASLNQCFIDNTTEHVNPSSKHQVTHVRPNCPISPNYHVSSNVVNHLPFNPYLHPGPNESSIPLFYKPVRFKPLYDISNGVFPHTHMRKKASATPVNQKARTFAQKKPSWTHYKKLILHPSVDDPQHASSPHAAVDHIMQQNSAFNNVASPPLRAAAFSWSSPENMESLMITKKPGTRSSPMGFLKSWPSSSSFSSDPPHHFADNSPTCFDCNDFADFLNSDRRPHSENDLNLHSVSYFLERPPSRCMKRPLSSCSSTWRNVSGFLLGNCMHKDFQNLECEYGAEAWSPNTLSSEQDVSIFIPRDLNGNILRGIPSTYKGNTSLSSKQNYPKSNNNTAEYKSRCFRGALLDLSRKQKTLHAGQNSMQRSKLAHNATSEACSKRNTGSKASSLAKKKPILAGASCCLSSCLDDLEGLPPRKWAKKLASDLMGPYRAKTNSTSDYHCKEISKAHGAAQANCSFGNGFKHRVKFASSSVQINNEGFQKEAQSLAAAEMIPDLLSWERDSGLLTGDPPAIEVHAEDEEDLDKTLLAQVEAMLFASSSSSLPSPSPSPKSLTMLPMHVCSLARKGCVDSSSMSLTEMELLHEDECIQPSRSFQKEIKGQNLEQSETAQVEGTCSISCVDEVGSKEHAGTKEGSDISKPSVNGSLINIHHTVALIEVMESKCSMGERSVNENDQLMSAESSPRLCRGVKKMEHGRHDEEGLLEREEGKEEEECSSRKMLEREEGIDDEYVCVEHDMNVKRDQYGLDTEWELEKLFQDSLDLNPTFRHLYDTMNHLNANTCAA